MADTTTTYLGLTKPGVADAAGRNLWGGKWNLNADAIDAIFKSDGTGTSVGLSVGSGKTLKVLSGGTADLWSGNVYLNASNTYISDNSDSTKNVKFDASGVATGTTRTISMPDANVKLTPTGSVVSYVGTTAPTGWLLLRGGTIGDASSGATVRANADTVALYTLLWNSFANAEAPVSTGRGASAAADFAAHKTITLPDVAGRVIAGKEATATRLTNAVSGVDGGTLGKSGGAQANTIAQINLPNHSHTFTSGNGVPGTFTGRSASGDGNGVGNITMGMDSITNSAFPVVQPTLVLNYIIAL